MSASPFQTSSGSFVEIPTPYLPDSPVEAKAKLGESSLKAEVHEFPAPDFVEKEAADAPRRKTFFAKMFKRRTERRLREEMLSAELQDLRASYAGLLHSTEEIRDQLEDEKSRHEEMARALSPFPAAVEGLEKLRTGQEAAGEVLTTISDRLEKTDDRDASLLETMDRVQGGIGTLGTDVGAVSSDLRRMSETMSETISELSVGQVTALVAMGDMGVKMEARFEKAAQVASKNAERVEQSNDDVLNVLKQMERNSQRGLWIFAILLAILFFTLIAFSVKTAEIGGTSSQKPVAEEAVVSEGALLASEPVAEVLVDELEF